MTASTRSSTTHLYVVNLGAAFFSNLVCELFRLHVTLTTQNFRKSCSSITRFVSPLFFTSHLTDKLLVAKKKKKKKFLNHLTLMPAAQDKRQGSQP